MISQLEREVTFRFLKTRKNDGFLNIISIFSFIVNLFEFFIALLTVTSEFFDPGIELQTLVDALNETGTTATDMVAILEALREAGALRAELIVI